MKRSGQKGFTLIQLLVVLVIAGFITKIVLGSVTASRTKANDAVVQSLLTSMRSQAEFYKLKNGNYGPTTTTYINCPTASSSANLFSDGTTGLFNICTDIAKKIGVANFVGGSDNGSWAAAVKLSTGKVVCNDSRGQIIINDGPLAPTDYPIYTWNNYCK